MFSSPPFSKPFTPAKARECMRFPGAIAEFLFFFISLHQSYRTYRFLPPEIPNVNDPRFITQTEPPPSPPLRSESILYLDISTPPRPVPHAPSPSINTPRHCMYLSPSQIQPPLKHSESCMQAISKSVEYYVSTLHLVAEKRFTWYEGVSMNRVCWRGLPIYFRGGNGFRRGR